MSEVNLNSQIIGKSENDNIILLHGWKHNLEVIKPLGELLSENYQIHLIDLAGHGKSDIPQETWGMKEFADSIAKYLQKNNIKNAIFIGHSFGGKTIIKLNSLYPDLVSTVVLINSSGLKRSYDFKQKIKIFFVSKLRSFLKLIQTKLGIQLYNNWFIPRFASADYKSAGLMLKTFIKTVNEHLEEELKTIAVPTLLLWGEYDTETPLEAGERMAKLINNSKLIVLKGHSHTPFDSTGAGLCAFYILDFLNKKK